MKPKKNRRPAFVIRVVPHKNQRYETVGDWVPGQPVQIRVSRMKDERYVFLVALHEMIEFELCRMKGICDKEIVRFDKGFEAERSMGLHSAHAEPGDDPKAPYRREHVFATMVEKLVAQRLAVRWSDYEKTVVDLDSKKKIALNQLVTRSRVAGAGRD